jgi:hypothetical protein
MTIQTMPPIPPTTAGPGMVGGAGFSEGSSILWDSDADLARRLDGIAASGATWLRVDVDWSVIEPSQGSYSWSVVDRVVNGARARGLRVLGILTYTPGWARPAGTNNHTPPSNPQDFATFSGAAVAHFAGAVSAWEVWNEPNIPGFWAPAANPGAYTALLRAASAAIKTTDPSATVLTGGTSPSGDGSGAVSPVVFLQGIYAAGGKGSFDAVAHHPYNFPYMPMRPESNFNWNAFGGVTPKLHDVMVANGDGAKRIWATEIGAPTPATIAGVTTTPDYLARYVTEAFSAWRSWAWTGPMFWYSYRDAGSNVADTEQVFGLVKRDYTPKSPALETFTATART